jgi:uncharacterized membrane protein
MEEKLSRVMLWGVLIAAAIMLIGGIVHLFLAGGQPVGDHIFRGEPRDLSDPVAIVLSAFQLHERSIIQLGVLLLLLNPLLRVVLSAVGFAQAHNRTYVLISVLLIAILTYSLAV